MAGSPAASWVGRYQHTPIAVWSSSASTKAAPGGTGRQLPVSYVAGRAAIGTSDVADIEDGRRQPSLAVLQRLAKVLGGDYDELARLAGYG